MVREADSNRQLAAAVDRNWIEGQVNHSRVEEKSADARDRVGRALGDGVDAELAPMRSGVKEHIPRIIDQGPAEALERVIRVDDGGDFAVDDDEDASATSGQVGAECHDALIVYRGERPELAEVIARCCDRVDCTTHARVDSLASGFKIGAKDD